ncbi:response regulator [Thermodesulfobacteriota bacterium]
MKKNLRFFVVDDDPVSAKLIAKLLKDEGHEASYRTSSADALPEIIKRQPDCVLLDIMMPEIDGLELCKRLRRESPLDKTKIIVVSGKSYETDRQQAFASGADGYILKPVDRKRFFKQVKKFVEDRIELAFWGVRGTLPLPGKDSVKYGGNTSCISLGFARGNFFIFDAGTGIKSLSDHLMAEERGPIEAKIFISHPHWDHINALPFFAPLYIQSNEFEICGPAHGDVVLRDLIFGQMDGIHFPIKIKEFSSRVYYRDLKEEEFEIDGIIIKTMLLNHPGHCLGFRVEYKDRSVCYVTDNELYPESSQFYNKTYLNKLTNFIKGTDALVTDCTYTDDEYESKISWGHSSISQVVDLADRAEVKNLYLVHHDPGQTDADIETKLETAQSLMKKRKSKTRCLAPQEGQIFKI